jgi:RNA polymerase sigma factor (sigma-70 family)
VSRFSGCQAEKRDTARNVWGWFGVGLCDRLSLPMKPTDLTDDGDDALFGRARDGDRDAFGELVRRHQRAALRVAAVISGSTEEANDIVQDAFVNVHRGLATYRASGSVRSWMLRIVANQAKNHVRGRVRRLNRDDRHAGLQLRTELAAEDVMIDRIERQALATALCRLPARDREVLGCRFVAELTEAETADVLRVAVGTVKSRTSRALERLRTELRTDRRSDAYGEARTQGPAEAHGDAHTAAHTDGLTEGADGS